MFGDPAFLRISMRNMRQSTVRVVAGCDNDGFQNGAYNLAKFNNLNGIVLPNDTSLYISDTNNNCIRTVNNGEVVTFVGKQGSPGLLNSQGINAQFYSPYQLCFSNRDNCFLVADHINHLIRKVTIEGNVSTLAGSGIAATEDGIGVNASFFHPIGITMNELTGDIYVSEYNGHVVRRISSQGQVTTIAGSGKPGFADGQCHSAMFNHPRAICFSQFHNYLFVCDNGNQRIRMIDLKTEKVGSIGNGKQGFKDGIAEKAEFNGLTGISPSESDGSLLVCDCNNHKIRRITFEGHSIIVTTIIEQLNSNNNVPLKCDMQHPLAIHLDNKTNICYFTTRTKVYEFYNSL